MRKLLLGDPLLERFQRVPSKDNGIDLEGFESRGGSHYLGLRGPVLRGQALIAQVAGDFSKLERIFCLSLEGKGIRSLRYHEGPGGKGFYVLAGSALAERSEFVLYRWSGRSSCFAPGGPGLTRIGRLEAREGKPEGLFTWGGTLGLVCDGAPGGAPRGIVLTP